MPHTNARTTVFARSRGLPTRHRLELGVSAWQLNRRFIRPGCPWTNGKAERFNRTLLTESADQLRAGESLARQLYSTARDRGVVAVLYAAVGVGIRSAR